jgi:hypothetical protein
MGDLQELLESWILKIIHFVTLNLKLGFELKFVAMSQDNPQNERADLNEMECLGFTFHRQVHWGFVVSDLC